MGFKLRLLLSSLISLIAPLVVVLSKEFIAIAISIYLVIMAINDDDQIRLATTLFFIVSMAYVVLRWLK